MSDTLKNRPEHEPAIEDLPTVPEKPRDVGEGEADATKGGLGFPDYAKAPSPAGPIPIPYPNF